MLKTYTSHYKVWKRGFAHFYLVVIFVQDSTVLWNIGSGQRRTEDVWSLSTSHQNLPWTWLLSSHKKIAGHFYLTSVIWPGLRQSRRWSDISFFWSPEHSDHCLDQLHVCLRQVHRLFARLNSLDCSTAGFSPVGWLALLHLFSLASAC